MFVGFGCQPGFRLYTSRQSFVQSCTQIGKLPLIFFRVAMGSGPFESKSKGSESESDEDDDDDDDKSW